MRTYTFQAELEGGFKATIDYRIASDGEVIECGVSSATTGEDLTQLVAFCPTIMNTVYALAEQDALKHKGN